MVWSHSTVQYSGDSTGQERNEVTAKYSLNKILSGGTAQYSGDVSEQDRNGGTAKYCRFVDATETGYGVGGTARYLCRDYTNQDMGWRYSTVLM
jgi:hypothetical protein